MTILNLHNLLKMAARASSGTKSYDQELFLLLRDTLVATESHVNQIICEPIILSAYGTARDNNNDALTLDNPRDKTRYDAQTEIETARQQGRIISLHTLHFFSYYSFYTILFLYFFFFISISFIIVNKLYCDNIALSFLLKLFSIS